MSSAARGRPISGDRGLAPWVVSGLEVPERGPQAPAVCCLENLADRAPGTSLTRERRDADSCGRASSAAGVPRTAAGRGHESIAVRSPESQTDRVPGPAACRTVTLPLQRHRR
jgi:hypothetical protein